jgi:hypothetical protein
MKEIKFSPLHVWRRLNPASPEFQAAAFFRVSSPSVVAKSEYGTIKGLGAQFLLMKELARRTEETDMAELESMFVMLCDIAEHGIPAVFDTLFAPDVCDLPAWHLTASWPDAMKDRAASVKLSLNLAGIQKIVKTDDDVSDSILVRMTEAPTEASRDWMSDNRNDWEWFVANVKQELVERLRGSRDFQRFVRVVLAMREE